MALSSLSGKGEESLASKSQSDATAALATTTTTTTTDEDSGTRSAPPMQRKASNAQPLPNFVAPQNPPIRPARLPPTIEVSLTDACNLTRQSFYEALCSDQRSALEPNYRLAFENVHDVIRRLLPYHVWHVRDEDIMHVMQASMNGSSRTCQQCVFDGEGGERGTSSERPAKCRKLQAERCSAHLQAFPSESETQVLWNRYLGIHSRCKRLKMELMSASSSEAPSPYFRESCYHLDKLAYEDENMLFVEEQENFRRAKEQAMANGITWEALMRISAGLDLDDVPITHSVSTPTNENHPYDQNGLRLPAASTDFANMEEAGTYKSTSSSHLEPRLPASPSIHAASTTGARTSDGLPNAADATSSSTSLPFNASSPTSHAQSGNVGRGGRPRGRPRKQRDEHGRIIRHPSTAEVNAGSVESTATDTPSTLEAMRAASSMPSQKRSTTQELGPHSSLLQAPAPAQKRSSSPLHARDVTGKEFDKRANNSTASQNPTSLQPSASTSRNTIPTHPIRLVLPSSTMARLAEMGIHPIPSPHLVTAIAARQRAAQNMGSTEADVRRATRQFDTLPRNAPADQQEAALLVGITFSGQTGLGSEQELVHISVLLHKLGPAQLSGLADLMQNLYAPNPSTPSLNSTTSSSNS